MGIGRHLPHGRQGVELARSAALRRGAGGVWLALLAVACGSADARGDSAGVFPEAPLVRATSEWQALSIEVRTSPEQPPSRGVNEIEIRLQDESGSALDGVQVSATPWMVAMGHGSSVQPIVRAEGGGRYVLRNVSFFMPGRWELRTAFAGAADDRAVFVFDVP